MQADVGLVNVQKIISTESYKAMLYEALCLERCSGNRVGIQSYVIGFHGLKQIVL